MVLRDRLCCELLRRGWDVLGTLDQRLVPALELRSTLVKDPRCGQRRQPCTALYLGQMNLTFGLLWNLLNGGLILVVLQMLLLNYVRDTTA